MVVKVHTLFFLFSSFFFAYCVVLFLKEYWKEYLALFRPPDLEKKNKYGSAIRMKFIILQAVVQSWNFADFYLYIGGETGKLINVGFPRCKTITMTLIFQSPVPLSGVLSLVVGVAFAVLIYKRCSPCSAVSCWRLLLRCSRWISSRRSRYRGVSVENLPRRGFGATCCACVSFALEIVRASPVVNIVSLFSFSILKSQVEGSRGLKDDREDNQ